MEYQKTNIESFAGIDTNLREELIKDQQASDIENLRFDKVGYLVNRNGVAMRPMNMSRTVYSDISAKLFPIGTMGITEYVLQKPWGVGSGTAAAQPYDDATLLLVDADASSTDRFMVYAVRVPANTLEFSIGPYNEQNRPGQPANHLTWRYKAAYVLSPLTGKQGWRDEFFFAPNGAPFIGANPDSDLPSLHATVGARTILRADDKMSKTQIYAPVRWLGLHNEFAEAGVQKDQNWIDHYVSMAQYRDGVIISDKTNGDMLLIDEWHEAEYRERQQHRFSLRENALAEFNVDDVVVDFGIDAGQFNDGVEAPLALYKFYLPRKRLEPTRDNYAPFYANQSESPTIRAARNDVRLWVGPEPKDSFCKVELWTKDADWRAAAIAWDTQTSYSFTMSRDGDEYDDLFGTLTLKNPLIKEDGQVSSDVYLWEEFKVKYYPSSGMSQSGNFLTGKDRTWDKSSSGGVKIVPLKTKEGVEQDVPLGIWSYRFVWYMGSGEYSAPSADLVVPDLLFSGLKDSDIIASAGSYIRPFGINEYGDSERSTLDVASTSFLTKGARAQGVRVFDSAGNLTAYGQNFEAIKKEIYYPNHEFAASRSSTLGASWPANWASESLLARGQFTVYCTTMWQDDIAPLQGVAVESAYSRITVDVGTYRGSLEYRTSAIQLQVQVFPGQGTTGYNSVFTEYGVPRTIYQNSPLNSTETWYDSARPAYQFVFAGKHRFGTDDDADSNPLAIAADVAEKGGTVWFNVVCEQAGYDRNNADDDEVYLSNPRWFYRNMTVHRGVRTEGSRINIFKDGLKQEVLARLTLSGIGEIPLARRGWKGTWVASEAWGVSVGPPATITSSFQEQLDRNSTRVVTYVGTHPSGGGNWQYWNLNELGMPFSANASYTNFIKGATVDRYSEFTNLDVRISGPGERLTVPEQLTMYIPASLLFGSPHVKLAIPADRIPRRARQLLVFRTRATHDNAWQPNEYGLVKSIDVERSAAGVAQAIEFLDDVKTEELDFSYQLGDYDGFVKPIRSRFCLPLNERVFYSNIVESYRPQTPRSGVPATKYVGAGSGIADHTNRNYGTNAEMVKLWTTRVITADTATANITKRYLYYFLAYSDSAQSFSLAAFSGVIDRGDLATPANTRKRVILYCAPSAYDGSVEQANVYRLQTNTPFTAAVDGQIRLEGSRTVVAPVGKVYYVVQGVVEYHGKVYYPKDVIVTATDTDSGVPPGYSNRFVNYFAGTGTYRGEMGTYCDPILIDITSRIDGSAGPDYIEKIGVIKPEDEGIFYDDDLEPIGRLTVQQNDDILPSAIRWSEPYTPNKIRLASLQEVRAGDGDQITGMVQLYGNLVVLKERSIHRLAVQGSTVPISRTDEISNIVGCIAPNTAIVVNNALYFLSWAGFYRYNNNTLEKMDGAFAEELQVRLRSAQGGVGNPAIRDASCGWNAAYRELYLCIPVMTSSTSEGDFAGGKQDGLVLKDGRGTRTVRGTIYAINVDTGFVTKYRYMDDAAYFTDPSSLTDVGFQLAALQRSPRVQARLYYSNTLGQMRSAEALPTRTYNPLRVGKPSQGDASMEYLHSQFYIESPTFSDDESRMRERDDFAMYTLASPGVYAVSRLSRNVRVYWRSKAWTAGDKTVLKRVRKVFAHVSASTEPVVIRGITHTSPTGPTQTTDTSWTYSYPDTRFIGPPYPSATGELLAVPTEAAGASSSPSQNRGERHVFEVEGGGVFQMEYFGFYWKPINQYER